MRTRRTKNRSLFGAWTTIGHAAKQRPLRRAPRRRDIERLEERQMLTTVGTPTDEPFFANQWHLNATGQNIEFDAGSPTFGQQLAEADINILGAWEYGVTGAGTQIVIADTGFDLTHEDLATAFIVDGITNLDLFAGDTLPGIDDATDASGTAAAGIIGARDNGVGTIGVAYQSDLIPLRLNPGDADTGLPTIDAINASFRQGAGLLVDLTGDGIPDRLLNGTIVPLTSVDLDGDGTIDGLGQDPSLVTDVFYHSGAFIEDALAGVNPRVAQNLPTANSTVIPGAPEISILTAIEETANAGRAIWVDANSDGLFTADEVQALGAIHVVPAGNEAGFDQTQDGSAPTGSYASSQYSELANSPFTITVGGVDFGGDFENDSTGTITSIFEGGANVLVVAPTGVTGSDIGSTSGLDAGIVTTDPTGNLGANLAGLPNFEFDGDFFPDTNYSSLASGSELAAAQVAGVISLMLEANPLLSRRDVEQILLQSAVTNDQFNESWIINQFQRFQDPADFIEVPQYARYNLDTNGDGEPDIEDAIIPNTDDPNLFFGYFLNEATVALPVGFLPGSSGFVDTTGIVTDPGDPMAMPPTGPFFLEVIPDPSGSPIPPSTIEIFEEGLFENSSAAATFLTSPLNTGFFDLQFENGVGYTVSQGYGNNLEEFGYAHGLVDAERAVELALAWEVNDLFLDDQVVITSDVPGGPNTTFSIQPRAFVTDANGDAILEIPGGGGTDAIDTALYDEFISGFTTADVSDADGNVIGQVLTEAPFSQPEDADLFDTTTQGGTLLPLAFAFDSSIETDFLSIEHITLTTTIELGDVDHLRFALLSPDGTQTELNGFRNEVENTELDAAPVQQPQGAQGRVRPSSPAIDPTIGTASPLDPSQTIVGSEVIDLLEVNTTPDTLPTSQAWTWTTNRHRGELFSIEANSSSGGFSLDDGWFLIIENHGDGFVEIGSQIEVSLFGTEVTGNRIQGKVGIDDNAQGIDGIDADANFNFNRFVEFAEVEAQVDFGFGAVPIVQQIVLDDLSDSVTYTNSNPSDPIDPELTGSELDQIYRTVDPDTGIDILYPVVSRVDYFDVTTAPIVSAVEDFLQLTLDPAATVVDLTYRTQTNFTPGESGDDALPTNSAISTPLSFRNFDYSQESFASGVTVVATQFEVTFDAAGNASAPVATGVVQRFTTGSDGNYYFDVMATPEPPLPGTPAYDAWFADFGSSFEYEISIEGTGIELDLNGNAMVTPLDTSRVLTNADEGDIGYFDLPSSGSVTFDSSALNYTVAINADNNFLLGATSTTENVNFLLTVDPAETNVDVSGTAFRDRSGDGVIDGFEELLAGVTVFHDADGNGALDPGEASGVTDANGMYSLTIVGITSPQNVSIVVDQSTVDPTLTPFNPADGELTLSVTPGSSAAGANFAFQLAAGEPAQVSGLVFGDLDGDGVLDGNEGGIDLAVPARVFIDLNGDGTFQVGEPAALTASDGTFNIESSSTGVFFVRLDPTTTALTQTTPASGAGISVVVSPGQTSSGLVFGLFDDRTDDFGDLFVDANNNYPTLLADNGARHVVLTDQDMFLGAGVDVESDGAESTNAMGDDSQETDDEDGVVLLNAITAGATLEFDITATGVGGALHAWIDFNNDGDWDDPGEQVFDELGNLTPVDGATTTTRLTYDLAGQGFPIAVDPTADFFAARFRWGPFGLDYDGRANAGEVEDYLLSANNPIVISGRVREDTDGDLVFGAGDSGVGGVVLFADSNLDGIRQIGEPSATTDSGGNYSLFVSSASTSVVTVIVDQSTLPSGVVPIDPTDGIFSQTLSPGDSVNADFLVGSPQGISGVVFGDDNNNATMDASETGLSGITVELLDGGGVVIDSTVSDTSGAYSFTTVAGTFTVRTNLSGMAFTVQSTASPLVNVTAGAVEMAADLGVYDQTLDFTEDFGDLFVDGSFDFPTTLGQNGARHTIVAGVRLGDSIDGDPGDLTSNDATADDNTLADDEDGVTLVSTAILPNSTIEVDVNATDSIGSGAVLNAWIDFNDDGDWDDVGEQVATDQSLVSGTTTTLVINTPATVASSGEFIAARFRWGSSGLSFDGASSFGEVEDYLFATNALVDQNLDPADYNADGTVDDSDRDTWQVDFGATSGLALRSDGNNDGVVNLFDFIFWREAAAAAPAPLVQPPTPGDYDADGSVDGDDLAQFSSTHGETVDPGTGADGSGDGVVGALDFIVWREAEAAASSTVSLLTAPEPEPEASPAPVSTSVVVDASPALTLQAVATAPVIDSALAAESPAEESAAADSDAVDLALLQLDVDTVIDAGEDETDAAPLGEEDEQESLELALDEGLVVAL